MHRITVNLEAAESARVIQGPCEQPAFRLATDCCSTRGDLISGSTGVHLCVVLGLRALPQRNHGMAGGCRKPQGLKTLLKQRLVYAWKPVIMKYSVKCGFIGKVDLVFRPGKLPEDCCCSQLCLTHCHPGASFRPDFSEVPSYLECFISANPSVEHLQMLLHQQDLASLCTSVHQVSQQLGLLQL